VNDLIRNQLMENGYIEGYISAIQDGVVFNYIHCLMISAKEDLKYENFYTTIYVFDDMVDSCDFHNDFTIKLVKSPIININTKLEILKKYFDRDIKKVEDRSWYILINNVTDFTIIKEKQYLLMF
jgi:hypothetical protein